MTRTKHETDHEAFANNAHDAGVAMPGGHAFGAGAVELPGQGAPAADPAGFLGNVLQGLENLFDTLLTMVTAQIESFFDGVSGLVDQAFMFAKTFAFTYEDGDEIKSVAFSVSQAATYDAETGTGNYSASITVAEAGYVDDGDGAPDSFAAAISYAGAGSFGDSDGDGLFDQTLSATKSVSAGVIDDGQAASTVQGLSHSSATELEAPGKPDDITVDLTPEDYAVVMSNAESGVLMGDASLNAAAAGNASSMNADGSSVASGSAVGVEVDLADADWYASPPAATSGPDHGPSPCPNHGHGDGGGHCGW